MSFLTQLKRILVAGAIVVTAGVASAQTPYEEEGVAFSGPLLDLARYAELSAAGDVAGAAEMARGLIRASADDLGLEADDLNALRLELARAMAAAGDYRGAVAAVRRVITVTQRTSGRGAYDLVEPLIALADIEEARGDVAAAGAALDRAIAVSESVLGEDHPGLIPLLERRAELADVETNACRGAQIVGARGANVTVSNRNDVTRRVDADRFASAPIEVLGCNEAGVFFELDGARVWASLSSVQLTGLPGGGPACGENGAACLTRDAWFVGEAASRRVRGRIEQLGRVAEERDQLITVTGDRTFSGGDADGDDAFSDGQVRSITGVADEAAEMSDAEAATDEEFDIIRVFYGTSRARTGRTSPTNFYSSDRAVERGLETGVVRVSVPKRREMGAIPKPSIWRGEFRPDPAKHVIVEDVDPFGDLDGFINELRRTIDASEKKEAFIYIHGFNNSFASAAERTAQLAADLELDGAPLFYTWPSRGDVISYFADANEVITPAVRDLELFLTLVAQEAGAERLHVVAHSMGNRYLIEALERIESDRPRRSDPLFDELVFAAPDVDADDFEARVPELRRLARSMTLYASEKDKALKLSRLLNGGHRRAGDASEPLVIVDLHTVDTSPAPSPRFDLGHEDVFEFALDDFRAVVWFSLEPQRRCILDDRRLSDGVVWAYSLPEPETCDADIFAAAALTLRRLGRRETLQLLNNQIELTSNAGDQDSAARWLAVRNIVREIGG